MGASDERAHGLQAQKGVDRKGIGSAQGIVSDEHFGVGVVRRPDISPFGIDNDQQPRTPEMGEAPWFFATSKGRAAARER